ncbi:hypothetical protein TNCV_819071 [Trichonephila clavipes]|nr:hypothetical protein TNCV_819071 [Trichonephila clavipes]
MRYSPGIGPGYLVSGKRLSNRAMTSSWLLSSDRRSEKSPDRIIVGFSTSPSGSASRNLDHNEIKLLFLILRRSHSLRSVFI